LRRRDGEYMEKRVLLTVFALMNISGFGCAANEPLDVAKREAVFDPEQAVLIAWADPWVCWMTRTVIDATRGNVAPTYVERYYVQKVGEASGRVAYLTRSAARTRSGTVFTDGTVFIISDWNLICAAPDAVPAVAEPQFRGNRFEVLAAYPDGAVIKLNWEHAPVFWVPFKDHVLDHESRPQIVRRWRRAARELRPAGKDPNVDRRAAWQTGRQ
jgi:hypothetical protein